MLNSQSGLPRSKTLEQNAIQLRSFPRVAQQCKYHLPLMVVGKIKKMLIAAIQHEEIMFASSGAGQDLVSQIHAAQVKSMTGNDSINARFLHCNSFDFRPQFKLYINTNYLPSVDDMSLFSSNRVRVIPFDRHFEPQEQDPNLKHLFAKEESKSAILNWLIAGWQLLQKEGLNSPAAVVEATKEYSRDSNKIALFAEEKLIEDRTGEARTAAVYERYKEWCDVNGCMPENSTNFKKSLQAIGTVVRRRPRDGSEKTTLLLGYRLR